MTTLHRNDPPTTAEVATFLQQVDFSLPMGFVETYEKANGGDFSSNDSYISLFPLTDLFELNIDYGVLEFAPEFFVFGSDGGPTALAIERSTGDIYEMPFIGMSREEAVFVSKSLNDLISE